MQLWQQVMRMGLCACECLCLCTRLREATAEPVAAARGMQYPVESNGTFMETAL